MESEGAFSCAPASTASPTLLLRSSITEEEQSFREHKYICLVCQKQFAKYACPRCNLRYCSLPCYKNHSKGCTTAFHQENFESALRGTHASPEERAHVAEALRRWRLTQEDEPSIDLSDHESDTDEEEEGPLDALLEKVARGGEIRVEDLGPEEGKAFQRAVASGKLSHLIRLWEPWWLHPQVQSMAKDFRKLRPVVQEIATHGKPATSSLEPAIPGLPPLPESVPPLRDLAPRAVSPLLSVHLVDILLAYSFTLRYYNGEWPDDPLGASDILLSISNVLGTASTPPSTSVALSSAFERACSPQLRTAGGLPFCLRVTVDTSSLLALDRFGALTSLSDIHLLLESATREIDAAKDDPLLAREIAQGESTSGSTEGRSRDVASGSMEMEASRKLGEDEASEGSGERGRASVDLSEGVVSSSRLKGVRGGGSREKEGGGGSVWGGKKRKGVKKRLSLAKKKVLFFMAWVNEQPGDAIRCLARDVDEFYEVQKEAFRSRSEAPKWEGGGVGVSKVVIEEL